MSFKFEVIKEGKKHRLRPITNNPRAFQGKSYWEPEDLANTVLEYMRGSGPTKSYNGDEDPKKIRLQYDEVKISSAPDSGINDTFKDTYYAAVGEYLCKMKRLPIGQPEPKS